MSKNNQIISNSFVNEIKIIIEQSRITAVRSVERYRVQMYWQMDERLLLSNDKEAVLSITRNQPDKES